MSTFEARRLAALTCAAIALTFVAATPAAAAPPARTTAPEPTKARAAELVANATAAYRKGDFQQAVTLLAQAYELDPQPVLLFNLGRAYEGLGKDEAAIDALSRYLAADPNAPDRGAIEQRIGTLKRQRDERIALEKQRDEERRRADEERRRAQQKPPPRPRERSVMPYVLGGVGVAGLATGTVFGLLSRSKHDDAASLSTDQATALHLQGNAKSYATVSTISLIAGGVLLAAGVSWWIVGNRPVPTSTTPSLRLGLGPGLLVLGGALP